MSDTAGWVVIVMPRGDVVRLDERFSDFTAAALFMADLEGDLVNDLVNHDTPCSVQGKFISVCWREAVA